MTQQTLKAAPPPDPRKFRNPRVTADGKDRACVSLDSAKTLWFNTGTLCNIECKNCYIESSPQNDSLVYITREEVEGFLGQIRERGWPVEEIGFTGGEPFMNPEIIGILEASLGAGHRVLVLTNAMRPMMRKRVQDGLLAMNQAFPGKLTLRISIDHYSPDLHDNMRGKGSFDVTIKGMEWLRDNGFTMAAAGRTLWGESDADCRSGFARLFARHGFQINARNPAETVLFPEMDVTVDVPEITTECWGILGKSPADVMCSSSRMVVKRKGTAKPAVVACTLLPYEEEFELGGSLREAESDVYLNHPHCAKFCVLGGASCSG